MDKDFQILTIDEYKLIMKDILCLSYAKHSDLQTGVIKNQWLSPKEVLPQLSDG